MTRPDPAVPAELADPPADVAATDDAVACELLEPELTEAAVSNAAPGGTASPASSRTVPGVRIPTDALIVTVPRPLAWLSS